MGYFWVVKWLKVAFDFYVRSSLHVAVAASSLFLVTSINNNETVSYLSVISLFLGTFAGYNIINGNLKLKKSSSRQFLIKLLTVLALFVVAVLIWFFTIEYKALIAIAAVLVAFYMIPFWKGKSLRFFPIVKLVIVALVWTIVTYYLVFTCCSSFESDFVGIKAIPKFIGLFIRTDVTDAIQRFVIIFVLCIPFEIRDLKYDQPDLKTLPQLFGTRTSKLIGIVLLVIYCWIAIIQVNDAIYNVREFIMIGITGVAIWFSDKFKSDYYASFFVEAIPVLWLVMLLLF